MRWILRVITSSVMYFPIYFTFGVVISPFVHPYYSDPSLGLRIPSFTVIIPLEFFRGSLTVVSFLPIIAAMKQRKRTVLSASAGVLFVPGALIPLISGQGLPPPIVPFHLVEILADSLVYVTPCLGS